VPAVRPLAGGDAVVDTAGVAVLDTAGVADVDAAGDAVVDTAGVADVDTAGVADVDAAGVAVVDTAGVAAAVLDEEVAGHADPEANDADAFAIPSPTPWCVLALENDDDVKEEDEASVFPLDLVWGKHRRWGKCESVCPSLRALISHICLLTGAPMLLW
jgi:hypothetical protein